MIGKIILGTLAFSCLKIWRGAGHPRTEGVNLWRLMYDSSRLLKEGPFGVPHIPYEEAVQRAREAYQQLYGGQ